MMKHEPTGIYVSHTIYEIVQILYRQSKGAEKFNIHCQDLIETTMHKHCLFQDITIPEYVDHITMSLQTGEIIFAREEQSPSPAGEGRGEGHSELTTSKTT